jgi:hypothetical protein
MNKYPFVRHEAALYRSIKIQVYKLNRHKKFANPIFGSILAAVFRHACSPQVIFLDILLSFINTSQLP